MLYQIAMDTLSISNLDSFDQKTRHELVQDILNQQDTTSKEITDSHAKNTHKAEEIAVATTDYLNVTITDYEEMVKLGTDMEAYYMKDGKQELINKHILERERESIIKIIEKGGTPTTVSTIQHNGETYVNERQLIKSLKPHNE